MKEKCLFLNTPMSFDSCACGGKKTKHHLKNIYEGGSNSDANKIPLCINHQQFVHSKDVWGDEDFSDIFIRQQYRELNIEHCEDDALRYIKARKSYHKKLAMINPTDTLAIDETKKWADLEANRDWPKIVSAIISEGENHLLTAQLEMQYDDSGNNQNKPEDDPEDNDEPLGETEISFNKNIALGHALINLAKSIMVYQAKVKTFNMTNSKKQIMRDNSESTVSTSNYFVGQEAIGTISKFSIREYCPDESFGEDVSQMPNKSKKNGNKKRQL